jgi:2-keto-3-deoxy-L-fuconate dehydrogenase
MSGNKLEGMRVLITQADAFMGPTLCEVFREHGASVIADTRPLLDPAGPAGLVASAGRVDALVANLAVPAPGSSWSWAARRPCAA